MSLRQDFSVSALIAGFVTVLVGFTSSAVIVFQAANTLGASRAEIASWMWALGLGMGLTCIVLSLRYKVPVVTAWSTPGAAMLITSASGVAMPDAIGAFLLCGVLIAVAGFSGWFERAMSRIPVSLASAMLAGVLLRFGLDVFVAMKTQFGLAFAMFIAYLLARRWQPRYAVILALALGILIAAFQGLLHLGEVRLELATPVFITPHWSTPAMIGVALPLFIVTMASQNVPGVAVIRASGYHHVPISPLIGWTGAATAVLAPFGAYALNLAAITAATGVRGQPVADRLGQVAGSVLTHVRDSRYGRITRATRHTPAAWCRSSIVARRRRQVSRRASRATSSPTSSAPFRTRCGGRS